MAILAKLFIEGGFPLGYNIISCEYEFNKQIDKNGKPCAYPRGGIIDLSFQTQNNIDDIRFHEWALSKNERKSGKIEFNNTDAGIFSRKILRYKYAHCIHLSEKFNAQESEQMITNIKISAAIISFGNLEFKNNELLSE